ncbi:MAG: ABC transporter permease [Actinobacteria bacterium]|nr:ABC transporter permease [Actinomycetota bacterium]
MSYLVAALQWLSDPANMSGPNGWQARMAEHLWYTAVATVVACVIGIPLGYAVGHAHRFRTVIVSSTGAARALPTLGVVTLFGLLLGIGLDAPMLAFVLLALPSVLAGAYAGVEGAPRDSVDAARAMGMTEWQILTRVEAPLGMPLLLGGVRSAVLQVLATATLAAYVGAGGLGRFLFLGLKTQNYPMMVASSLVVMGLAIVLDLAFEVVDRLVRRSVPAGAPAS